MNPVVRVALMIFAVFMLAAVPPVAVGIAIWLIASSVRGRNERRSAHMNAYADRFKGW